MKNNKVLFALFILIPSLLFSQPLDPAETERILNEANEAYTLAKYEKAYDLINQALAPYQGATGIPENIKLMAEAVYYSCLQQVYKDHDYGTFTKIESNISRYPQIASDRISRKINRINSEHEDELLAKRAAALKQNRDREWAEYDKQLEEHRKSVQQMSESIRLGFSTVNDEYVEQEEQSRKSAVVLKNILFIFAGLFSIAAVAGICWLVAANKRRHMQEEQFDRTLRVVAALKLDTQERLRLVSGGTLGIPAKPLQLTVLDAAAADSNHVSGMTSSDCEELRMFDSQFKELGEKIDRCTVRRNNSRNVSELVYKLCRSLDIKEPIAILYYYAAMVYDAGFLSVDSRMLTADHLTVEERKSIRGHVDLASQYFDFIPQRYLPVFIDAAQYHHENFDGSGYQNGLSGSQIPDIARVIRVVESYLSLTNKRSYHAIMDKDSAFVELKRTPGLYDSDILAALEEIV